MRSLRIVLQPVPNSDDAWTDADVHNYLDLVGELNRDAKSRGIRLFMYMILPEDMRRKGKVEELYDNLVVISESRKRLQFWEELTAFDGNLMRIFNMRYGKIPVDVWVTSKVELAPIIQRALEDYRLNKGSLEEAYPRIPVIIYESRVIGRTDTHNPVSPLSFLLRAVAYALYPSVVASAHEIEQLFDVSRLYLSDALFSRLVEQVTELPFRIDFDEIDRVVSGVNRGLEGKKLLFWGGRFSGQKNVDFILDVYNEVYLLRDDVKIVLTTMEKGIPPKMYRISGKLSENKDVKVLYRVDRYGYWRWLARANVFLSASLHEGLSVGHAEAGYLTSVVVPRRPWAVYMFGSEYKWMYDVGNKKQAIAMILRILDNPDEALALLEEVRERIRDKFGVQKSVLEIILGEYDKYIAEFFGKKPVFLGEYAKLLADVVEIERGLGSEVVSISEIERKSAELSRKNIRFELPVASIPSRWMIYQYLKNGLGLEDTCKSIIPEFYLRGESGG